jgi:Glutamine amidotransferases class-II
VQLLSYLLQFRFSIVSLLCCLFLWNVLFLRLLLVTTRAVWKEHFQPDNTSGSLSSVLVLVVICRTMIASSVSRFAPNQLLRRGSRRVTASSYSSLSRSSLARPSLWYSTERILQLRSGKAASEQPKVLYDPKNEKENCGVGLIASLKSVPSRHVVDVADEMLVRMSHRGGCGCDPASGDGAGESML